MNACVHLYNGFRASNVAHAVNGGPEFEKLDGNIQSKLAGAAKQYCVIAEQLINAEHNRQEPEPEPQVEEQEAA